MAKTRTNQPVYGIESNNLISGVQTQYVGSSGYKYHLVEFGGVMFFHFSFTSGSAIPANATLMTLPTPNHTHEFYGYTAEGIKIFKIDATGKLISVNTISASVKCDIECFFQKS